MSGDHLGELIFINDVTSWKHLSKPMKTTNRDLPIMYINPLEAVETGNVTIRRSARPETEPYLEATILSQTDYIGESASQSIINMPQENTVRWQGCLNIAIGWWGNVD